MARGHAGLPKPDAKIAYKHDLLDMLGEVDQDSGASARARALEVQLSRRIQSHVQALPVEGADFKKFFTSPYVLLIQAKKHGYTKISEIEHDILPAKVFSSMETSAGRAVEDVTLPIYGWTSVISSMHTSNSSLDGKMLDGDVLRLATLKSGPRCLNDEMSENFADAILANVVTWANDHGVKKVDFTYGVLYGTPKLSNKKDWHILRNLYEKHGEGNFTEMPTNQWNCTFSIDDIEVRTTVRIGLDWWSYLGGPNCLIELAIAIVRACVPPGEADPPGHQYVIGDLSEIVSIDDIPDDFNPSILQRSQIPWFFFFLRHFFDQLRPGRPPSL